MSADTSGDRDTPSTFPWLRRCEQIVWLLCLVALMGGIAVSLATRYARSQHLIEIDPSKDPEAPSKDPEASKQREFLVDINRADWPEFAVLPDIGENYARSIVELRNRNGDFDSIEDLLQVRGIGDKTLERLRPYLTISLDEESAGKIQATAAEDPVGMR